MWGRIESRYLHLSLELGILVGEQTQAADWSPLADTDEIPEQTDLSSIIEENIPEKEDGAGLCFLFLHLYEALSHGGGVENRNPL